MRSPYPVRPVSDLVVDCSVEPDMARQEFAADADINSILRRHGPMGQGGPLPSGSFDFDVDLQGAFRAVSDAKAQFSSLPREVQRVFGTWEALARAIDSGEVTLKPVEASAVVADGSAGSASDSAPVKG